MVIGMKKLMAFKFKLKPTTNQRKMLAQFAGCRRFVFNKALALQMELKEKGEPNLSYAALCRKVTEWRNSGATSFLADAPAQPLQQSVKDLDRAFVNFFAGRTGYPHFKKRNANDAFRYPEKKTTASSFRNWGGSNIATAGK